MNKFIVSKSTFSDFLLTPLSKFDLLDNPFQLIKIKSDLIGITHNQAKGIICEVRLKNIIGDDFDPVVVKETSKLKSALDFVVDPTLTLSVNGDHLFYDGDGLKLKSYFLDNRFFDEKQSQKLDVIKTLEYNTQFVLTQSDLLKLKKSKQFVSANKVYITCSNSKVILDRKDDEKTGLNTLSFNAENSYSGDDLNNLPLLIDIFDLISDRNNDILIKVNKKLGVLLFTIDTDQYIINYTVSALRK